MAAQARRSACPEDSRQDPVQDVLALSPAPAQRPRRPLVRRRTGPCTISYRLVAARAGRRVVRLAAWGSAVQAHPAVGALRADARASLLALVGVLAAAARPDATTAPTWPVLVERTESSRASVARQLAWLREQGLLTTLENGSTPKFRPTPRPRRGRTPAVVVEGNRAAVYLLTAPLPPVADDVAAQLVEPAPEERPAGGTTAGVPPAGQLTAAARAWAPRHETPPLLNQRLRRVKPPAQAREDAPSASPAGSAAGKSARTTEEGWAGGYRRDVERGSRGQQRAGDLAAAEALRQRSLDLRPLSAAAVRAVIRPFLAAGWDVQDLVHAIDHTPDGQRRTFTSGPATSPHVVAPDGALADVADLRRRGVRTETPTRPVAFPAAWLTWRLGPWAGRPGPAAARRQAAADRQQALRAAATARRAAAERTAAAATPTPPAFTAARRALRERAWTTSARAMPPPAAG